MAVLPENQKKSVSLLEIFLFSNSGHPIRCCGCVTAPGGSAANLSKAVANNAIVGELLSSAQRIGGRI